MRTKIFGDQRLPSSRFVTDPNRRSPRKKVCVAGLISMGDKSRRMECTIVDMSSTGARLQICPNLRMQKCKDGKLRDRIALFFDQLCTNVECVVIWENQHEVGVQFCSAFHRSQSTS